MTEDQSEKLDEMHRFWFKGPTESQPSRADQFDTMLRHYNNGKFALRSILWIGAAVVAVTSSFDKVRTSLIAMLGG